MKEWDEKWKEKDYRMVQIKKYKNIKKIKKVKERKAQVRRQLERARLQKVRLVIREVDM